MALQVLGITQCAVVLGWDVARNVETYTLTRDGEVVYQGDRICYTDHGLEPGVTYKYMVFDSNNEVRGTEYVTTHATMHLVTDRTEADVKNGTDKGFYNILDIIRVSEVIVYVTGLLRNAGFDVTAEVKLDWQLYDIPTVSHMEQYVSAIQVIRTTMDLFRTTPDAPKTMDGITWETANNIEQILLDAEFTVLHVFEGIKRAGQHDAWCGQRLMIPTGDSDLGRTWEALDAMETTWNNWQKATWFLLLYGNLEEEGDVS